jgi:RNA polymerase sigma-70 factor (ECF subfamily)
MSLFCERSVSKDCNNHHKLLRTVSNFDVVWASDGRVCLATRGDDAKGIAVRKFTSTESIGHTSSASRRSAAVNSPCLTKVDGPLIARLRPGEERAFDELVSQQHGALIRMAMGYVADREVAEEVVQDTWMAVIESLHRFEGRSSIRTWICGILIHKAKDRGVREKRHTTFSDLESYDDDHDEAIDPSCFQQSGEWAGHWAFPPQPWDDRTPETLLMSKQAVDCMQRAIDALPVIFKEVLVLCDGDGIKTKDVCKMLDISATNLYVRLHRARQRVRATVEIYLEGGKRMV